MSYTGTSATLPLEQQQLAHICDVISIQSKLSIINNHSSLSFKTMDMLSLQNSVMDPRKAYGEGYALP